MRIITRILGRIFEISLVLISLLLISIIIFGPKLLDLLIAIAITNKSFQFKFSEIYNVSVPITILAITLTVLAIYFKYKLQISQWIYQSILITVKAFKNNIASLKRSHRIFKIAVILIFIIGFVIRFNELNRSPHHDEAKTVLNYVTKAWDEPFTNIGVPNNHLLNSVLMKICYSIFGYNLWVFRLPAFIFGLLLLPSAFYLGRLIRDNLFGILLMWLTCISIPLINYSVNARAYSGMTFFSLLLIIIAFKSANNSFSFRKQLAFSLVASLGIYFSTPMLIPIALALLYIFISVKFTSRIVIKLITTGCLTLFLTFLFYLPAILRFKGIHSLISNPYVSTVGELNSFNSFIDHFQDIFGFLSLGIGNSLFLFILFIIFPLVFYKYKNLLKLWLSFTITILAFYLIKQIAIPLRVFTIILPVFLVFITFYIWTILKKLAINKNITILLFTSLTLFFIYRSVDVLKSNSRIDLNLDQTLVSSNEIVNDFIDLNKENSIIQFSSPHACIPYYLKQKNKMQLGYWTPNNNSNPEDFKIWDKDTIFIVTGGRNNLERFGYTENKSREGFSNPILYKRYSDADLYLVVKLNR